MENENNRSGLSRSQRRKIIRRRRKLATPFFAALFLLFLVAFIIPLRPDTSTIEKRELAKFPEFSAEALLNGDYFDGISTWFSDTFPGRESWLSLAAGISNLHGISTNVVDVGRLNKPDTVPAAVPTIPTEVTPMPRPTYTPPNGESAQAEAPAQENSGTGEPSSEEPAQTQEPEEISAASLDDWTGLSITGEEEVIFGAALQIDDTAYEYFGFNQYLIDQRTAMMGRFAGIMEECGVRLFDMPIPSAVGVLLDPDILAAVNCSSQAEVLNYIFGTEDEYITKVNIFNNLVPHNNEYIYFRTDHHWTALGAYYGYEQFCKVAGFEPVSLDEYTEVSMGDFLGSFYASSSQPGKLRTDELIAYCPPGNIRFEILDYMGNPTEWDIVRDMSDSPVSAKYTAFIAGDNPLSVITNDDLPDAPNCAIIKDSYGNPFSIYLAQHYHKVYIIDYRDYTRAKMRQFVEKYEISDMIMAESLSLTQGEGALNLMNTYIIGY